MTATAPQAAVSWSSVAKNVGPRSYAAGGFLVLPAPSLPSLLAGEGREGGRGAPFGGGLAGRGAGS